MESGFKEFLPPKLKGFIVKRQAKLTHDQAKHLHFYIPTRGLEADKMVDALNRLDQTDALVEQILRGRAKLEHHANRGRAHPNSHAQAYPMEAETTTSSESNHSHNHKTSSDTESDQLDWDPERNDDDGYPLVDENWSTLVPVPREGPLDEDEASSLTAWAQGYREVRKNLRDSVTGRGCKKPESSRSKKVVRKTMFEKETTETRPKHPHSIPRQSERSQHRRAEKTHPLLPLQTTWTYGKRVSESSTEGHSSIFSREFPFCQEMLLHSCTICRLTCCTMVHPRLLWDATLI